MSIKKKLDDSSVPGKKNNILVIDNQSQLHPRNNDEYKSYVVFIKHRKSSSKIEFLTKTYEFAGRHETDLCRNWRGIVR